MPNSEAIFKKDLQIVKKLVVSYKMLVFAILILAPFIYVAAIFYLYAWKTEAPSSIESNINSVDSNLSSKIPNDFDQREQNFVAEPGQTYVDPFY